MNHGHDTAPPWCEMARGNSAVLLVAPHGGRRPPVDAAAPPPHLRVNDLYTPEITRELASVLRAGFLINHGMDRNTLDLNRITQVRRGAAWFLSRSSITKWRCVSPPMFVNCCTSDPSRPTGKYST